MFSKFGSKLSNNSENFFCKKFEHDNLKLELFKRNLNFGLKLKENQILNSLESLWSKKDGTLKKISSFKMFIRKERIYLNVEFQQKYQKFLKPIVLVMEADSFKILNCLQLDCDKFEKIFFHPSQDRIIVLGANKSDDIGVGVYQSRLFDILFTKKGLNLDFELLRVYRTRQRIWNLLVTRKNILIRVKKNKPQDRLKVECQENFRFQSDNKLLKFGRLELLIFPKDLKQILTFEGLLKDSFVYKSKVLRAENLGNCYRLQIGKKVGSVIKQVPFDDVYQKFDVVQCFPNERKLLFVIKKYFPNVVNVLSLKRIGIGFRPNENKRLGIEKLNQKILQKQDSDELNNKNDFILVNGSRVKILFWYRSDNLCSNLVFCNGRVIDVPPFKNVVLAFSISKKGFSPLRSVEYPYFLFLKKNFLTELEFHLEFSKLFVFREKEEPEEIEEISLDFFLRRNLHEEPNNLRLQRMRLQRNLILTGNECLDCENLTDEHWHKYCWDCYHSRNRNYRRTITHYVNTDLNFCVKCGSMTSKNWHTYCLDCYRENKRRGNDSGSNSCLSCGNSTHKHWHTYCNSCFY